MRKAHPDALNNGKETGWVISIMARGIPLVDCPEIGEDLISNIGLRVYDAWAPYLMEENRYD
ncbi:MAG: hypothetical protein GY875_12480 [Gammaproteobacteria bacterium]|nr:hypothetical protein [Gammaproteobacteria bacterium]